MTESKTVAGGILRDAADLIEPEGAWTQNDFARDSAGNSINVHDDNAVCFCALGAIRKAGDCWTYHGQEEAVANLQEHVGHPVAIWNDHPKRTQAEVVAFMRGAAIWMEEKL